jgi:FixJ family two-component response regulator
VEPPPVITEKFVHVVDDDASLLRGVARLLRSHGYAVKTYSSAAEFLGAGVPSAPGCLLLDLNMPGMTGLELQKVITDYQSRLAIVFISGQGDIPATVKAMKAGAVDFLTKPFEGKVLVAAIETALGRSITAHALDDSLQRDWALFATLSPRERQVCLLFAKGMLNKQIAGELGTTERTIKAQRASVMRKLSADSVPDVVRLVDRLRSAGRLPEPGTQVRTPFP